MKVCLAGLLNNARSVIPEFEQSEDEDVYEKYQKCERHCPASELMDDHMIQMAGGISEFLSQTIDNINLVKKDPSQLPEFLELYSLPSIDEWSKSVEEKQTAAIKEIITTAKFRRFFHDQYRASRAEAPDETEICGLVALCCGVDGLSEIVSGSIAQKQWQHLQNRYKKYNEERAAGDKDDK